MVSTILDKDKAVPAHAQASTAAAPVAEVKPPSDVEEAKRVKSAGEVIFNRVVYTGIGFGVNEASSLWITDQFVHGAPKWWLGGKWFSKEGFDAASAALAKTFKTTKAKAGNTLLMATLLSGGTLLVLPMKWLEENKLYWVKKANHLNDRLRGNSMTAEEVAARDAEVEQAIACSPQQGWPSLLLGRGVAMFSSWASGTFLIGPERNKQIMDGSQSLLVKGANAMGMTNLAKNETFNRYSRLIGVETYSCLISSIVLEVTSKFFASFGREIHDPNICAATAGAAAKPAATTTGNSDATGNRQRSEPSCSPCKAKLAGKMPGVSYTAVRQAEKDAAKDVSPGFTQAV